MSHACSELRVPGLDAIDWSRGESMTGVAGRGTVRTVSTNVGRAVIRHYRRGGAFARVLGDRYWYTGAEATRCFREFRLLQRLVELGLPVCRPLAARFERSGFWYRAELATLLIPGAHSLHVHLLEHGRQTSVAAAVGSLIGRFHAAGLWHADLNAHNVLCDENGQFWLIDLDRSRMRAPAAAWQRDNIERLLRSLRKLGHLRADVPQSEFVFTLESAHRAQLSGNGDAST